jgi:hypothetical protein
VKCSLVAVASLLVVNVAMASLSKTYDFSGDSLTFTKDTIDDTIFDVVQMHGLPLDQEYLGEMFHRK